MATTKPANLLRRAAAFAAGGLLTLMGAGVLALALGVLVPVAGTPSSASSAAGRHTVLVLSNPIHTDIALPAEPTVRQRFGFLADPLGPPDPDFPADAGLPLARADVGSIVVGWGGRSFYTATPTWADLKPGPVLRSFTGDASVLHLELAGTIDPGAEGVRAYTLDDAAFERMLTFIEASFRWDDTGQPIAIPGTAYGAFDRFFEAEGRFTAFAGCNAWTARALRAAGITTGLWTPLPQTLAWSLDLHG